LEKDKGVETLLAAAASLPPDIELVIAGDGPLSDRVRSAAAATRQIRWLGQQPRHAVLQLMKDARLLLFPSAAYENFPVVLAEAYATGLPVVGSRLGSTEELVTENVTGALFPAGDSGALAKTVGRLLADPEMLARLRCGARAEYERRYTADACYRDLIEIYGKAEICCRRLYAGAN
jgi:glycosyltransferase involved in cell wall biosynthesis